MKIQAKIVFNYRRKTCQHRRYLYVRTFGFNLSSIITFKEKHIPAKETSIESKLSIYALNYSSIYDLHSSQKRIHFVTDYDTIHNRVRRYIYNPATIINHIKIQSGEIFPCVSCGENISITKMTAAWNNNACPYCGGKIRIE